MKRLLTGLTLVLIALPAWAQSRDENWAQCGNFNAAPDLSISSCSAIIQSGQETSTNLALVYTYRSEAYINKGLYDQTLSDTTQAIALNPNYANAYNERAWAYHMKGQDTEGLPDADRAVALTPSNAYHIETRAEIYEKIGQRDKAIADYRETLKFAPLGSSVAQDAQNGMTRLGATP